MNHNYCSSCGMQVMPSMRICPTCGNRTFSSSPPPRNPHPIGNPDYSPPSNQISAGQINYGPSSGVVNGITPGVKGWLMFFCFTLVITKPLFQLGDLLAAIKFWNISAGIPSEFMSLKVSMFVITVIELVVFFFSIYTGVQLWLIKPKAVVIAKKFLVIQFLLGLIGFLIALWGFPDEFMSSRDSTGALKDLFRSLGYGVFWYTYLEKSKRVKATYPASP